MQGLRCAFLPLLCAVAYLSPAAAVAAKVHTVTLGPVRRAPYTPAEANQDNKGEESGTLRVRPLAVDGTLKEWTVGEAHDVTDRSFVIRRALRINDALPGEAAKWTWQPGPWLLVDRVSGHITALHLPAFDPEISNAVWFRDYAAYCGVTTTAKGGLVLVVTELGRPQGCFAESRRSRAAAGRDASRMRRAEMAAHAHARDSTGDRRRAADLRGLQHDRAD